MSIEKVGVPSWVYLCKYIDNYFPQRFVIYTFIMYSLFSNNYLNQLPIYRRGLSLLRRGLEIGIIHGYLIIGPFTVLGPLRAAAEFNGFLSSIILVFILTLVILIYAYSFPCYVCADGCPIAVQDIKLANCKEIIGFLTV